MKIKNILLGSIPFLLIIFVWFFASYFNIFPNWMIPTPQKTIITFFNLLFDGTILNLIFKSCINLFPGFIFGVVFAIIIGVLIGINKTINKILYPLIASTYPIPSLAWLPLIILFLGFTRETIWFVIFVSSFKKIIYNVIGGVKGVNKNWILAAKNLGLSRTEIIFKVILPGALPQILTGIRMGFSSSWKSLIGAEMLAVSIGGLGKFIWLAQWSFSFEKVFAGIIIIALIGLIIEFFVFKKIEKITLSKWGFISEE